MTKEDCKCTVQTPMNFFSDVPAAQQYLLFVENLIKFASTHNGFDKVFLIRFADDLIKCNKDTILSWGDKTPRQMGWLEMKE